MKVKYKRIIDLIEENRRKTLHLERKYLPELIDDGWYLDERMNCQVHKIGGNDDQILWSRFKLRKGEISLNYIPFLIYPKKFSIKN